MNSTLRIIADKAQCPGFNMAADLFLLRSCEQGRGVIVRLYEWKPASISIGYMQKPTDILDGPALLEKNIAWVRRPTGGRAILHEGDITYSCIFPASLVAMGRTVMETYSVIATCLMAGLRKLGIQCTTMDSFDQLLNTKREVKLPCFLAPNRDEIMVGKRKLVGSAQKRDAQAVLQHGSIPISDAYRTLPDFLSISEDQRSVQKRLLAQKSICLHDIDPSLEAADVRQAISHGFTATLPFEAEEAPWSIEELEKIEALMKSNDFKETWMTA